MAGTAPRISSGRKRVLFLAASLADGGAQRVFSILLRHLDRDRFEPHLGVLQAQGTYLADLPEDVVVHDINVSRVRYSLPGIVKLIRKLRPEAVMATMLATNLALILSKPFLPSNTRILIREAASPSELVSQETSHPRFWRWVYRHLYKRADRLICLSDAMVNDMVTQFSVPREKIVRIYNPVEQEKVRELSEVGGNPYSGPGPHLVSAGRLSREKGFDLLLSALPKMLERFPNTELAILGEGRLKRELMEQAARLGLGDRVHFLGFEKNPWRYFRYADLFVLASRHEGMPNALLEALAVGTPAVAADCPGGIREIQSCVPQMVLVPPEDPSGLADAIIAACSKSTSGAQKPQRAQPDLSKFNLQYVVRDYSALF